jgi:hypothetical protein
VTRSFNRGEKSRLVQQWLRAAGRGAPAQMTLQLPDDCSCLNKFFKMSNGRREFIRKSWLLSGVIGLGISPARENPLPFNEDGDRLVLLGTQGGPFIRSYKQTPCGNLRFYYFQVDCCNLKQLYSTRLRSANEWDNGMGLLVGATTCDRSDHTGKKDAETTGGNRNGHLVILFESAEQQFHQVNRMAQVR